MAYWDLLSAGTGIAPWLLVIIIIWSAAWKIVALWKSARNNHRVWFVAIFLINLVGILEIIYIFGFSKSKLKKTKNSKSTKKKKVSKKK